MGGNSHFRKCDITESLTDLFNLSIARFDNGLNANHEAMMKLGVEIARLPFGLQNIGMLIDFVVSDPEGAAGLAGGSSLSTSLTKIKSHFKKRLQQASQNMLEVIHAHEDTGLQDGRMALAQLIPNTISSFIIPFEGLINTGIIKSVKKAFIQQLSSLNYRAKLEYLLDKIETQPELRKALKGIQKPENDQQQSCKIIRIAQGLPLKSAITHLHAQRTGLSALLSHLRQSPGEESCFTTSIAIGLLNMNPMGCICDFASLLKSSKMTRNVNGIEQDFPFVLRMNGDCLEQKVQFDRDGRLLDENSEKRKGMVWEAPGIKAACVAIGINDSKEAFKKLYIGKGGSKILAMGKANFKDHNISLREIFHDLAKYAANLRLQENLKEWELFNKACFTYESLIGCHPLLRVWENALAGMAEATETSMVKTGMIESVLSIFREFARRSSPKLTWEGCLFEKDIHQRLLQQSHPQYDPGIDDGQNHNSVKGAFVLYSQSNLRNSLFRMRVDSSESFQNFLKVIVDSSKYKIPKSERTLPANKQYIRFLKKLSAYIETDHFVIRNLSYYHPENLELIKQQNNYNQLRYTPWITRSGNNPKVLLQVYYEKEALPNSSTFLPNDAMELLRIIIAKCQEPGFENRPHFTQPLRRPGVHAFSWLSGMVCIPLKVEAESWIEKNILIPGFEVANASISEEQKSSFLEFVHTYVSNAIVATFIENEIRAFDETTTLSQCRNAIINTLTIYDQKNKEGLDQFTKDLDIKIYQTLPPNLKSKLEKSAFHAFDSNISQGINDIDYCFVINPGSGQLTLWESLDNKTLIKPLDSKIWFNKQVWEFYNHPSL